METEIWKDIVWYEGLYQVSNMGNIISINYRNTKQKRLLKNRIDKYWYIRIWLTINCITKEKRVHRLVAQAFIPNLKNKPHINHINWIKTNNRVKNLEWCTRSENELHAHKIWLKTGTWKWKVSPVARKVLQFDLKDNLIQEFNSIKEASKITKFSIDKIQRNCHWKIKEPKYFIFKFK